MIWEQIGLALGWRYRCRCGAIVANDRRLQHEQIHRAFDEFFTPPTAQEIAKALVHDVGNEGKG